MFRIKYAIAGGFGGLDNADWETLEWCNNIKDAYNYAEECAKDLYESYGGMHGLESWEDIREEYPDYDEKDIDDLYNEAMDSWIEYVAEEL